MKRTTFFTTLFLLIAVNFYAKQPIKFGKVSKADLEMTTYSADTSAPAVILCKYAYFRASDLTYSKVTRIKILKKEGLHYGTFAYVAHNGFPNIRGVTSNLINEEVEKDKLNNKNIIRQKVTNDLYKVTFNMPNVKVGSVIDIESIIELLPSRFYFQEEIPVKYCEITLEESTDINYKKNLRGFIPIKSDGNTWTARDVPAFHAEPYISSRNNYITKFEFEVIDVNIPGYYKAYTTSWNAVSKILYESSYFGGALEGAMFLNDAVDQINASCTTDEEKFKAAHRYVQKIRWNGNYSCYASGESMNYIFKQEYGNSADINITLILLLQKLGYEANPVVMSSRGNGILYPYPCWFKLDYLICEVIYNGKSILMDATDQYLPYYLLPERAINYRGRMVNRKINKDVVITYPGSEKEVVSYNLVITEDFSLHGTIQYKKSEYAAYDFRKHYRSFNSKEEYLEDFVTDKPGLEIVNAEIENINNKYESIQESYEVEIRNQLNVFDDEIYLTPMLFEQIKENPFKDDTRLYPIDFVYPFSKMYAIKVDIPEGYALDKLPEPVNLKLPDNKGSVLFNVSSTGNYLQLICKVTISNPLFTIDEYPYLKEFYNQIIKKQAEPIVLKKVTETAKFIENE